MMTSGPSILTCLATALAVHRPLSIAFTTTATTRSIFSAQLNAASRKRAAIRYLATSSSDIDEAVQHGISRLLTLQTLLSKHGAPGSRGCIEPNDLVPVDPSTSFTGQEPEMLDLHPHLFPLARSEKSGHYVCALRRAYADDAEYESSTLSPWPIVESYIQAPGMRLLALNSEHLMRRIACEADDSESDDKDEIIAIYNDGLGQGKLTDRGLDSPYEPGSVSKLGYGVDKYTLLRVGPFPDLYESVAMQHAAKGDESSALIAAESANGKFVGFGSTFAFYSKLLSSFPNREDESKDAARICLRLPFPSAGLTEEDFAEISRLAGLAGNTDSTTEAIAKLKLMYEKVRKHDQEDGQGNAGKTPEQISIDEANYLIDETALAGGKWSEIRSKLGDIYHSAGKDDMAVFVDPSRS